MRSATDDGDNEGEREVPVRDAAKRECPVPKPGGLVGQVLGFRKEDRERPKVPVIRVEPVRRREEVDGGR